MAYTDEEIRERLRRQQEQQQRQLEEQNQQNQNASSGMNDYELRSHLAKLQSKGQAERKRMAEYNTQPLFYGGNLGDTQHQPAMTVAEMEERQLAKMDPVQAYMKQRGLAGNALTPDQQVDMSRQQVGKLSDTAQNDLTRIIAMQQDYDTMAKIAPAYGAMLDAGSLQRRENTKKALDEAEAKFKKDNNLSDEEYNNLKDMRQRITNAEYNENQKEEIRRNINTGNRARDYANIGLYTVGSTLNYPVRGAEALLDIAAQKKNQNNDLGVDIYGKGFANTNLTNNIRQEAGERIANGRLGETGRNLYQTGASIADSIYGGALAGAVVPQVNVGNKVANWFANKGVQALGMAPTIGASAAATAYQDARNRGLDEKSAEATALASGLIEIGTESVSLDNLFDVAKGNSRLLRKPLIQMLASAGIEGSEEWASEGLNAFADWLINDGQSEYEQAVEQYKANGMTDKEARNRAKLDVLHDANEAFKWGAVSGILPGAGATAIGTAVATRQARNLDRNMDYEALGRAISTDESQYTNKSALRSAETAKQQAEDFARRKERGEKISNRELRDLYWNMQDAATTETESRGENNESPNPSIRVYDAIPDIITNKMENDKINSYNAPDTELTAENVTRKMAQAVTADQLVSLRKQAETSENEEVRQAAQNAFEINQGRIMSNYEDQGPAEFEAAEAMPTRREAFNTGLQNGQLSENASTEAQIAYREGRAISLARASRQNVSENIKGLTVSADENSKLTGQIKMAGKELQAVTDNGTVAIDKIADPAVKALYQNAAEQGTKEAAQVYLDNYATNMPIGRYTNAFDRYSVAGATNTMQFEEMYNKDTLLHKWMSKDQLQRIYDFGAREAAQQKLDNAARQNRAIAVMGTGRVIDNTRAGIGDSLMHMVQAMAKATGKDYVITDKAAQNINGYFNRSMQMVVLNAKNSDDLLNTLFHEGFGEVLKAHNAEGYDRVQQSIMDYLAENPTGFTRAIKNYQGAYTDVEGEKSLYDAASEMINDSIAGLFSTEEGIHDFSEWADKKFKPEEKKTLFQNIADYFAKLVDSFKEMLGRSRLSDSARQAAKMGEKRAAEIRQMILKEMDIATENAAGLELDESLRSEGDNAYSLQQTETIERIREDLGKDAEIQTAEDGTFQIATNNDTAVVNVSDINYSLKTLDNTQKKLAQVLKDKGHTQEEIDYALDMIQRQAELLQDVASGYMEMGEALQADIITDIKGGKQVIRSLVKNGEYPVNVDFMTICKKRQAYMKVLTDLIDDGTFSAVSFAPDAIVDVNNILRMNGYETACLGCFVESRRLQIQKWSESFVDAWNKKVRDVLGDQEPKPFNFGRNERGTTSLSDEEIRQLHEEFQNAGKKNVKGNINLGKGTVEQKMERLLEKMPTMARTLEVGDILKPNGVDNLRNHYGDLYSLLLQWYGSNTPKVNQDFNPYNGEFNALNFSFMKVDTGKNLPRSEYYKKWAKNQILSENGQKYEATKQEIEDRALQKYLYDIGGARLQSFSDFLIENSLDYFQMIGDLAAKEFPMHAYSKEISFARIFGMTGMKENMSLIPVVNRAAGKDMAGLNPDGSYAGWGDFERHIKMKGQSFIQSIGWKDAIALQLDPRYSKNVGTIAIGISDAHIRKMLNDPLIRMVIPYHSSGMNPQFAKAMNIDFYTDYTDFQNTTVKQYYDLDGNPVDKLEGKLKVDLEYNFNEAAQRLGDARAAAQEYIEWCAKEHPVFVGKKKVGTAVFTPKFESFTTGEGSENYYKLLEDFNMYDAITEEAAPQGAVRMMYPDAQHMLTEQQLKEYEQRLRDTGEFTEKDIQKYVKKAQMSLEDIIRAEAKSRNEYHRTQDAKYDETYKAIKDKLQDYKRDDISYSVKVDSQGRDLSEGQQEYFKNSKIRDENGALKVMYHGTQNDFTVFDFSQGGKNGTAEGFGIYLTDNPEVSQSYGDRIIEGYANITKPAYSDRRTIKRNELAKLIKETVSQEAKQLAEDYDGDLKAAEKDTWISNYVDTYNQNMKSAINETVDSIMQMNDNDMDIIQEVMTGMAIRDYPDAVEFYDTLTRVTGIDGFLTNWTSRDNGSKSLIALAFRSNQIKNVDNQNPTDNQDIRYSLSNDFVDFTEMDMFQPDANGQFAEEEMASILEEGAAVLKDVPIDKKVIGSIARKMTKFYGSSYSSQSLADNLEKVFAYAKDSDLSNARDLARVVKEVAIPVIEAAENKTGGQDLQAAKQALSGFNLDLTDRQRQEVMHAFGSYVNYKREMKKLGVTISANGSSMDSMWTSLTDALPGTLPEDTVEGDMPIVLYDQLVGLGSRVENGFGMDNDEAAQDLALKIMSEYYTEMGKQEGIKKADQAKLQAQAQRSKKVMDEYRNRIKNQYDKRYQKQLEKLQERYDEKTAKKMASLEAASKRKAERSRDAALAREEKDRIRKNAGKLMDMLQHPTKTKHVPAVLQDTVIDLVSAIDFVAPKITKLPDGRFQTKILVPGVNGHRNYETYTGDSYMEVMNKYQEALANGQGTKAQKTWQAKLSAVRQLYKDSEAAVASGDAVWDYQNLLKSDLGDALERVITENNGRPSLQSLSSEDLKVVNKVVRNIYTAINNIDKSYSMPEQVSEIGSSVIKRGASMKSQKDRLNASKMISRFMKLDNATPETFFHGMGEAGDKIYKALFEAQNQKARFEREDRKFMDTIFKRVPIQTIQSWTSDKSPIVYEDGDFKLRVDQIMTLYEINKRQSTQAHQYEGFKAGTIKINGKEHIDENPHILTKEKINEITSHLTEDQKWVADQLQQYMATVGSKRGNDQTLKIYGYEMFTEPDYFPAQVDKTTVQTNAQNSATEGNINGILNAGFTKEIQPNAKNPLILNSIFDVYLDHMNQVNTYASHAGVLSDINRINNYKEKENIKVDDQTFGRQHTVKQALDSIFGSDGKEYLVQFLKDVNQQEMATKTGAGVLAILTKNFKSAATLGNLRVVAQQPTAWCRALAVMDPKYMAAGLVGNKDAAKLQKETSMISWIKDNGNIDGLTTQSQRAQVLGLQTRKEKINELTGWLAGKADSVTWAALYRAVYAEQKDKFKGNTDSDEFKKAVNDRFDEVIARTQVVDGTLMRSQMMRSKDRLNMNFSAFMAEPTKTYNMFLRQFNDMIYEKRITGKIPRKAWEMMSRIIAAHVITQFVNAIPQSVMDAARDEEEGSTFWERFLSYFGINVDDDASALEKAFTAVEGNFLSNLGVIDKIPVLSTINDNYVWPWIKKLVWGESTYTSSADNEFQALNAIDLALKGTAFKSDKSKLTKYGSAARIANAISMVTGIPAYGLIRDTVAIYNSLNDLWGGDNIRRNEATSAERAKPVLDVIKAGGDYKAAIEKAVAKGAEYSKIETQIADAYKQQYIDLMAAGNTSEASKLENRLLAMFEYLDKKEGQKSSNKKRVKSWYTDWQEKQKNQKN